MSVFISWSGDRSKIFAEAVRDLLNGLFQGCGAWISTRDLSFGSQILESIRKRIAEAKVGIVCVTPENATNPWLLFESGAIFSGLPKDESNGENSGKRVIVVFFGETFSSLEPTPLKFLYAMRPSKEDFLKLVFELNGLKINGERQSDIPLERGFDHLWPQFERSVRPPRDDWSPATISS